MEPLKIGFLSNRKFDDDAAVRGAILVTNEQTKPLEFRVTGPVRPTNFQKTLYGEVLMDHILVELLARSLFDALDQKPDIVIVREPLFLGANDIQTIPVVRIFSDGEVRFTGTNTSEQINSLSGKYEPILVETSRALEPRLPEFRKQLSEVFSNRNLLEPFDRINTALQQIHSQKIAE